MTIESFDLTEETIDWGVRVSGAPQVWHKTQGEDVKVMLIDTGIDENHPDLKDNIKVKLNLLNHTNDVTDDFGHGTNVASIVAANGKLKGVAPKADLYIAKVLDKNGIGSIANVMDGITYAMNCGVDILSISLGMPSTYPPPLIFHERIQQAVRSGIAIVCATGNTYHDVEYPARYDEVIAVGGVDKDFKVTDFSGKGRQVDFAAPSVDIMGAWMDGKYSRMTGTSQATPIVVGAIALLISHYRKKGIKLTPAEIKSKLIEASTNGIDHRDDWYGYGMIDIDKLIGE